MARRTANYHVTTPGRDYGKVYLLTEMPAMQAEEWAGRFAFHVAGDFDLEVLNQGGMAVMTELVHAWAKVPWPEQKELLREMMTQITICPDPNNPSYSRPLVTDDIEEVATRLQLRDAMIELHTGFSVRGFLSRRTEESRDQPPQTGPNTAIYPVPSELLSRRG
jgi:hypothetical protein